MMNNELFKDCIHAIRNMKKLSIPMLHDIIAMSDEQKMEIIKTFNDALEVVVSTLE